MTKYSRLINTDTYVTVSLHAIYNDNRDK